MRTMQSWLVVGTGLMAGLAAASCGGDDLECGPGTTENGGECIGTVGSCGPGTKEVEGVCVPDCPQEQYWNGVECTALPTCAPGTQVSDGTCVPSCANGKSWNGTACVGEPTCGDGTQYDPDAGACLPTAASCGAGTHFENGKCVPDATQCGAGTHEEDGGCVKDPVPPPDVPESSDPQGEAAFDLPASGATTVLGGRVDTPADLDGDGMADPDFDTFTFEAKAGTWLRLGALSKGAAHPALAVVSEASDSQGYPLFSRYLVDPVHADCEREIYLPRDGKYAVIVSDYDHVVGSVFGWNVLPVGGDDFLYRIEVENLGVPSPKAITSPTAADSGDVADGKLHFFSLQGLAKHDARVVTNVGVPTGHAYNDVFGAVMVFAPDGSLVRERISGSTDQDAVARFAATTAGAHLVVFDHLMTIGDRLDFAMNVAPLSSTNCGTGNCSSGTLPQGEDRLLYWELAPGDLFAAGLSLPSDATTTVDLLLLDEGLTQVADDSSASKYGNAKALRYAEKTERVYLRIAEHSGNAVPSYSIDARVKTTPLLTPGQAASGLAVVQMPAGTYENAGYAHLAASANRLLVSTDLAVSGPNWTAPQEEYLSTSFGLLGPALDTTSSSFPNSAVAPLMAWVPTSGHCLHRVRDANKADIGQETWGTTLHEIDPVDLGTPKQAQPSKVTQKSLDLATGLSVFRFSGAPGPKATVTVTPKAGNALRPEVWVATQGAESYSGGKYTWNADPSSWRLGIIAKATAANAGTPVSVQATPVQGLHVVMVRDAAGTATAADLFDLEVALEN